MMKCTDNLALKSVFNSLLILALALVTFSCNSNTNLADRKGIEKRRYQAGYNVRIKTPLAFNKSVKFDSKQEVEPVTAMVNGNIPLSKSQPTLRSSREAVLDKPEPIREQKTNTSRSKENSPFKKDKLKPHLNPITTSAFTKQEILNTQDTDYYGERKLNTLALLSFIFAILSFFIAGIPLGIAAVVCGIIGVVQITKNPEMYKGQGFAIVGIIVGLIAVVLVFGYLASQ